MKYLLCVSCVVLVVLGCANESPTSQETGDSSVVAFMDSDENGANRLVSLGRAPNLKNEAGNGYVPAMASIVIHEPDKAGTTQATKKAVIDRKIVYNADVHIIVEDLEAGEKKLKELITQHAGQIASSDLRGSAGSQRTGRWKVRIPVVSFEAFNAQVEKIGNLERSSTNSSDVTEEFYDVEARLKNKKVEETRLINHLEKTTGKLSDILEVEKELSRVRGEIEQMQGRMNMLSNLTSLTTIDVNIREVKNYVPPTAASFGDDASRSFSNSWAMLKQTGRRVMLNLISIVPWLPIWAVVGVILYYAWRWLFSKSVVKASNQ